MSFAKRSRRSSVPPVDEKAIFYGCMRPEILELPSKNRGKPSKIKLATTANGNPRNAKVDSGRTKAIQ